MKEIGTPHALRCVFDATHRTRIMGFCPTKPRERCLCNSKEPFGQCCGPIKKALESIFNHTGKYPVRS
ncbi:unnamed protein product [Phytomonas sp. EM1]|nr:unnamed protein product [Phytomonas sp. EM1]|eukprot:CCW63438.1 unnamed protein product [Phytomonas sp. isolate EM1]